MKVNQLLTEDTTLTGRITLYDLKDKKLQTGLVNVDGDVIISNQNLIALPAKFSRITGNFYCDGNKLTSLEGAPSSVGGNFYGPGNKLTSLEGAPSSVGGNFYCHGNKLTSLEGAPNFVGHHFFCNFNNLETLDGAPASIGKSIDASINNINSLIGINKSIKRIGSYIHLEHNFISKGGLGLLMIDGLTKIIFGDKGDFRKAGIIINKYLVEGDSRIKGIKALYLCEDELIQAGLGEFAQI